ncbi:MAG: hypothetical protein ABIU05_21435 [Nitrospirales bacterium]
MTVKRVLGDRRFPVLADEPSLGGVDAHALPSVRMELSLRKGSMKEWITALQSTHRSVGRWALVGAMAVAILSPLTALPSFAHSGVSWQLIPILGLTTDDPAIGTVTYLALSFEAWSDRAGLMVHFQDGPERVSRMAQASTEQAIRRAARLLSLSTDSWSVMLAVPYDFVPSGVVMTGTMTSDGGIGSVGGYR